MGYACMVPARKCLALICYWSHWECPRRWQSCKTTKEQWAGNSVPANCWWSAFPSSSRKCQAWPYRAQGKKSMTQTSIPFPSTHHHSPTLAAALYSHSQHFPASWFCLQAQMTAANPAECHGSLVPGISKLWDPLWALQRMALGKINSFWQTHRCLPGVIEKNQCVTFLFC